jgi:hypothetical protein
MPAPATRPSAKTHAQIITLVNDNSSSGRGFAIAGSISPAGRAVCNFVQTPRVVPAHGVAGWTAGEDPVWKKPLLVIYIVQAAIGAAVGWTIPWIMWFQS